MGNCRAHYTLLKKHFLFTFTWTPAECHIDDNYLVVIRLTGIVNTWVQ